ncbi:DUF6327 family protein [Winogradskyella ursingii]|uniref:DUF6327 family protein n=1 Tax=Winogradskyella ursingii TaxID=2686079 RepID=UPI0015CCE84A|nr:DUF6327 family protein [Winogradskyella ursingii]
MSKVYTTFEQIESDLKRFKLERDIAWEELKLVKNEYKDELKPLNWITSALKFTSKYGIMLILKRIFFRK